MNAVVIEARREGYAMNQIRKTMTVRDLIEMLEEFDEDSPVYVGNDPQSYGFYTYGGITRNEVQEMEEEDEDDDE